MSGAVVKRSVMIAGHRTSVSLEQPFWDGLRDIAEARDSSIAGIVAAVDAQRGDSNLSSAIRLYVLAYYRNAASTIAGQRQV